MRLTVKTKLIGGFLIVAFIALAIGITGYWGLKQNVDLANEIARNNLPATRASLDMEYRLAALLAIDRLLVNTRVDSAMYKQQLGRLDMHFARLEAAYQAYEPLQRGAEEKIAWDSFVAGYKVYKVEHEDFIKKLGEREKLIAAGAAPASREVAAVDDAIFASLNKEFQAYLPCAAAIGQIVEINEKDSNENSERLTSLYAGLSKVLVIAMAVGFIAAVAFGLIIATSIIKALREVMRVAAKVADSDLTEKVSITSNDELGELASSINSMIMVLNSVIGMVRDSANQIAASSEEMSSSAQSVSQGAQNQASTVEEISASIEELTSSISDVAKGAQEANQLAETASRQADSGGKAVGESVESTKMIARSSEQISEIIGTISEIADQTNLLALNAAIEAARAGEHGMGFAVVADEVRKLAERSSQAAREISTLIKESSGKVQEGTKLAIAAGDALREIVDGVEKTAGAIAQISSATEEQTATADEVAKAIQNVASITEENSGAAEEMASASEELASQAEHLRSMVAGFKI